MKRRTKVHFKAIHVSIPIRLLEDFDATLDFHHSRSKRICSLIEADLNGGRALVHETSSKQLMRVLTIRDDVDNTMKTLLLEILSQSS